MLILLAMYSVRNLLATPKQIQQAPSRLLLLL